jgi:hypothetical protein
MSKAALKTKIPDPRLSTIQMIEAAIKKAGSFPSKNKLRLSLPRQIQYAYFNQTLKYLEESNKIMYNNDGAIFWIFADNPKLRKLLSTSTRLA